jgi:hydroxyacylglutathione hydrolase
LQVELIPAFSDNYLFVGTNGDGNCFVVDPGDATPVIDFLSKSGFSLDAILVTHHHGDHVGGVKELARRMACERIIGPSSELERIPFMTELVGAADGIEVCGMQAQVMFVPGHTSGHICYFFPTEKVLFCGDTLFSAGCGRMFEGTKEQMWKSLEALRNLPDDTRVYCAHEYTLSNIRFALSVDPENAELMAYAESCKNLRAIGKPTIPTSIGLEKKVNPFLRVDQISIQSGIGRLGKFPAEVFGELRRMKDEF